MGDVIMESEVSLILLVGLPGAGKSTYANKYVREHKNTIHLSSDSIRLQMYGEESIQGNPADVFSVMQKRVVEALNDGQSVVYDATNITRKDRSNIINVCPKYVKIECHIIWAPIETCIERDASRERTVGESVIDRMLKRFQAPYYDEGIDSIEVIRPRMFDESEYYSLIFDSMDIPHDNPHHTLSITEHCVETTKYLFNCGVRDLEILYAALYHDVGKPYVKSFTDTKGNPCDTAHYYQHQCVGTWVSYGLYNMTPYTAWLISSHMEPYFDSKYYRNLPPFMKKDIDLLHEADLAAH